MPQNMLTYIRDLVISVWHDNKTQDTPKFHPMIKSTGSRMEGEWRLGKSINSQGRATYVPTQSIINSDCSLLSDWLAGNFVDANNKNNVEFRCVLLFDEPLTHQPLSSDEEDLPERRTNSLLLLSASKTKHDRGLKMESSVRMGSAKQINKAKVKIEPKIKTEKGIKAEKGIKVEKEYISDFDKTPKARTTMNSRSMIPGRDLVSEEVRNEISQLL
jgi:hypothetical protein